MQLNERKIFTVPNQKVIEISPGNGREEGETYGIITRREEMTAAKLLNDKSASLMLYYHFALNQDGYEFALSPTEIQEKLGITLKQYYKSIENLKRAGYLAQSKPGSNRWKFLRVPKPNRDFTGCERSEKNSFVPRGRNQGHMKMKQRARTPPKVETCVRPKGEACTPEQVETCISAEVEKNNRVMNNTDNINAALDEVVMGLSPIEKENYRKQEEKSRLIEKFKQEFGYLDDCNMIVLKMEQRSTTVDSFINQIKCTMKRMSCSGGKVQENDFHNRG